MQLFTDFVDLRVWDDIPMRWYQLKIMTNSVIYNCIILHYSVPNHSCLDMSGFILKEEASGLFEISISIPENTSREWNISCNNEGTYLDI